LKAEVRTISHSVE